MKIYDHFAFLNLIFMNDVISFYSQMFFHSIICSRTVWIRVLTEEVNSATRSTGIGMYSRNCMPLAHLGPSVNVIFRRRVGIYCHYLFTQSRENGSKSHQIFLRLPQKITWIICWINFRGWQQKNINRYLEKLLERPRKVKIFL